MNRRAFVTCLGTMLATPFAAGAQQAAKTPRIGVLMARSASDSFPQLEAFRERLRERGWIEGQDVVLEYRSAEGGITCLRTARPVSLRSFLETVEKAATFDSS